MSTIRIKRSGVTGSPTTLALGELAYSYLPYDPTVGQGGDRLYIGVGQEDANGHAADINVIGGRYFTEKLDHAPGTLTANSAIIVGPDSKIDVLYIDDITIDGDTISSANSININVGNTAVDTIDVGGARISNLANPTAAHNAANRYYVDFSIQEIVNQGITFGADVGNNDIVPLGSTLIFAGNTGITTTVTDQQIDIDLDDTAVTAGTYGSTTEIPVFTVDQQGRLTYANTVPVATTLSIDDDFANTIQIDILTETLSILGQNSVDTNVANNTITISLQQDIRTTDDVTFNALTITTDAQVSGNLNVTGSANTGTSLGVGTSATIGTTLGVGTDLTVSQDAQIDGNLNVNGSANTGTTLGVGTDAFIGNNLNVTNDLTVGGRIEVSGNATIIGDLYVQGNTVTVATETLLVEDNIIFLNANNNSSEVDLGWVGNYNEDTGNTAALAYAGLFRDATDNRFKVFDGYIGTVGAQINTEGDGFSLADIQAANFHGELQGNANTASALDHNFTINLAGDIAGNTTIDFSGTEITINAYVQPDSVALGTDTTGDYVATLGIATGEPLQAVSTNAQTEGATYELSVSIATAQASTPTKAQLGVAAFDAYNFDVSAEGLVTIDAIDGGTY